MKFWMVFAGLLLIGLFSAPALQAQTPLNYLYAPYYPPASYLGPYYPGGPAYYPGAYYPGAYYPGAYYSQPCYFGYVCDQSATFDANQTINTLTRRVQQLNETVELLQGQIAVAQTQQPQPRAVEATAPSSERPAQRLTLIFKNGKCIAAQGYAIMGQSLWILTPGGFAKVALSELDMAATQRANTTRGVLFGDET
jgi:hypothetical protein